MISQYKFRDQFETAQKALEISGADPKKTIYLDDLGINLKPAKELGMTTIKVLDSDQALKELGNLVGINFE